jgi:TolA protein
VSRETRHTTPTPPPTHDTTPTREAAPKKHVVDVDLSHETHADKTSSKKATDNVQAQAAAHAAAQAAAQAKRANAQKLASEISSAFSELNSTVGSTASAEHDVAMLGEGGGEAFVNYRTAVFNAYYHAWRTPDQTTHSHAVVDAKIVVLRDGTVTSSEFVSKSGDSAVDRSVQRALDAVSHLPAFPAATQDVERTFIIRFDLEAKQEAG